MKHAESINTTHKQALSLEGMEHVGGGFIMQALAGLATVFVNCWYDFADAVNVAIFGMPKDHYHH